jgi:hypothetical protein
VQELDGCRVCRLSHTLGQWHPQPSAQGTLPSLVQFAGKEEPPYTFAHYTSAPDARDLLGKEFPNKAERVKVELWVSLPRTILFNTSHSLDIF